MKKLSFYLIALLLIPAFIFTSCKDEEKVEPASTTLANYLTANHMDISDVLAYTPATGDPIKFVTGAPATDADVAGWAANFYIIDIRSTADFAAGHITGAHNVAAFSGILTEAANAGDKRILMVCYTGQTACYATALLRLAGHPDAQALKWGMSGWNSTLDKWTTKVGDIAVGNSNWTTAAAPATVKYDTPALTEAGDGATILAARVATVFANGFKTVNGSDVLDSPSNYFINNYFSVDDYTAFGHFDGAYRINPLTIADDYIKNIDPTRKVVTYCYTGQTSAIITAYLNVLGYDAYSLLFGMNGLNHSSAAWSSNQWGGDSNPKNLSTVTK
ncbi:MAG: rhodanese-like domain-containing protein [Bacteroidales bacterium]|nr:rhodanese-like domain-containing protein [Bacteroidales bacterium]